MFNSVKPALNNSSTNRYRIPSFLARIMIFERRCTSKPSTNPPLADNSKVFLRALQDIAASNEVKLMRLTAMKVYNKGFSLFQKHILLNPKFQASLSSLKSKVEEAKLSKETLKSKEAVQNSVVKKVTGSTGTSEKSAEK